MSETKARRRRSPQGRGRLQAWALGEQDAAPRLDGRALQAALEPVLRAFGRTEGRALCVVWTYAPPDVGIEVLAAEIAKATLGSAAAAAAAAGPGEQAQPVPFALALASMLTARLKGLATGPAGDEQPN